MIKKLLIAVCLMACASSALALGKLQGYVEQGGNSVTVAGFLSQTKVQKSFPSATVTVYLNGTSTLATLYADSALTAKANPFTAASDGKWEFYAADGDYDVRFSGGGIAVPYTWSGMRIASTSSSGAAWVDVTAAPYLAKGDGTTDDAAAFTAAAAVGRPLWLPPGKDFVIASPVTIGVSMYGGGRDDNQATITLTSTGQLITGDQWLDWSGFYIRSSVNNKTFIKVSHHYFQFSSFRLEATGGATGQVGINFDTTTSIGMAGCKVHGKLTVQYPFLVNGTGYFNNNEIGGHGDYYSSFASAIRLENSSAVDFNHFGGYFETGTNAINIEATVTAFRHNTFDGVLDAVTRVLNTALSISTPNWWKVKHDEFTYAGAGVLSNQIMLNDRAVARAYLSGPDQIIGDAAFTKITLNLETVDNTASFDAATDYRFTAKYPMRVLVTAQADITTNLAAADRVQLAIYKNGSAHSIGSAYMASASGIRPTITDVLDLAKSDYIEIFVWADQAAGAGNHVISAASTHTYVSIVEH